MLWAAGALAFVARMPQLGAAIYVVVVINGVFAYLQELRAERAAEKLRELLPRAATVVRDRHRTTVDASELVVGDVLLLAAGDRVPADVALVRVHALALDTSTLTGESVPDHPGAGDEAHAGTFVVEGEGLGLVTATGAGTRLGAIALLTRSERRPRSPLAHELDRVVLLIARVAAAAGVGFFAVAVLLGTPPSDGFLFAIGVTVALVPEGLLPTVTLSLARGAQRMARRNALVRRLEAVETLGATTFVCTDKTGTLTLNQMEVVEVWSPAGPVSVAGEGYGPDAVVTGSGAATRAAATAACVARACSDGRAVEGAGGWVAEGDPMEAAVDALRTRLGAAAGDPYLDRRPSQRFPFDPVRRRMSVVVGDELLVKGAPEAVLPRCDEAPPTDDVLAGLTGRGLRVLAVARRRLDPGAEGALEEPDGAERHLELVGLLGFEDPPRAAAPDSLRRCRGAGIRVAMVTGDHPATAKAIAVESGLATGPGVVVLTGDQLPADDDALGELVDRDGIVVARVTPEAKLRIARALQERGHVVAMTGDGVNDGPALQQADIGVAMGRSGTDVAREAADLVLLDDDIETIVAAVEQGRATYANVRRFLTYHLTDNVAELTPFVVWALSAGRIPSRSGSCRSSFLDIGTDLLPALALGGEPPGPHVLERPPTTRHLIDRAVLTRVFGVLGPVEATVEMVAFLVVFGLAGWRPGGAFPGGSTALAASGAAFATVVVGQAANAFACRSTFRAAWRVPVRSNPLVPWAVLVSLVALAAFLVVPPVADLLEMAPPPAAAWPVVLLVVPVLLGADRAAEGPPATRLAVSGHPPRGRLRRDGPARGARAPPQASGTTTARPSISPAARRRYTFGASSRLKRVTSARMRPCWASARTSISSGRVPQ